MQNGNGNWNQGPGPQQGGYGQQGPQGGYPQQGGPQQGYQQQGGPPPGPPPQQGYQQAPPGPPPGPPQGYQQQGPPQGPGGYSGQQGYGPSGQQQGGGYGPPQGMQGYGGGPQQGYGAPPAATAPQRVSGTNMWDDNYEGVTNDAVQRAEQEAAAAEARRAGGGGGRKEWKPLGPRGEVKWKDIPYNGRTIVMTYRVWIVGAPTGDMPFEIEASHFYKSRQNPNGTGCACTGPGADLCAVCFSRKLLWGTGNKADADVADKWKIRKTGLMHIILIDDYQQHLGAAGQLEPMLWRASPGIVDKLEKILKMQGGGRLLHPVHGRPFIVTKSKTGPKEMDIEWDIQPQLQPEPLNAYWRPLFESLPLLSSYKRRVSVTEMAQAILAMGYPMTPEVQQRLHQTAQAHPEPPRLSTNSGYDENQQGGGYGQQQGYGQQGGGYGDQQGYGQQGGYGGQQQSWQQGPGQNPGGDYRSQMADQVRGGGGGGRW